MLQRTVHVSAQHIVAAGRAQLGSRRSERLAAGGAGRPVERDPMVYHRIGIRFTKAGHLLVEITNWLEEGAHWHPGQSNAIPMLRPWP